jgi:hypothetical protein
MPQGYAAVARLYQAWITGLILMVVSRRGASAAAELVFRLFRHQQQEKFLPGLEKLGLSGLPAAVASAQYHYLSNLIGGVRVEYVCESDAKAWIRYPPPRWMWEGTAICAVPGEVSRAVLRGWHAQNGIALGNPRLGFVCTKQTVDGQDALEGYFLDYGRALREEERLRFAPDETAPPFDPARAPVLPAGMWTEERRAKARRNYAMDYLRSALPQLLALFGPAEANFLAGRAAYLVGLQFCEELAALLGVAMGGGAPSFAEFFRRLAAAQGDEVALEHDGDAIILRQKGWRLMPSVPDATLPPWNALWQGCAAAYDRALSWRLVNRTEDGIVWRVGRG